MSTYDKIAWLPLCAGLTGLGMVLSYLAMRRRGVVAGLRGAAWSLLPLAAYLTGAIEMFWKMGVAIGDFATGFVFSARVWTGIAVAGLAGVLLAVSGGLRRRRRVKRGAETGAVAGKAPTPPSVTGQKAGTAGQVAGTPGQTAGSAGQTARTGELAVRPDAKPRRGRAAQDEGDDMKDIEEILRRHGIS